MPSAFPPLKHSFDAQSLLGVVLLLCMFLCGSAPRNHQQELGLPCTESACCKTPAEYCIQDAEGPLVAMVVSSS